MEVGVASAPMGPNVKMLDTSSPSSRLDDNGRSEIHVHERDSSIDNAWVETLQVPVFAMNLSRCVTAWNRASAEITRVPAGQILDKPLDSLIHTSSLEKLKSTIQEMERGGRSSACDLRFMVGESSLDFHVKFYEQRASGGQLGGIVCFAEIHEPSNEINPNNHSTINDTPHAPVAVENGDRGDCDMTTVAKELRQLIDTANIAIFGVDTMGLVNEWNYKTTEVTGFAAAEVFDRPLIDTCIAPPLLEIVEEVLASALRGRGTSNFELEIRNKEQETRYLLVNATPRRDVNFEICGVVCIAQDVTEAIKHDRAVAAMADELRQFIDTANAPIFGIDRDG